MSSYTNLESRCCEPPPARLVLCLFGPPQVMVGGEVAMGPGAKKALALLAYLALEPDRPHPRGTLAALFWPDQSEKQARQDLRQTLSRLRTAIGDRARFGDRPRSGGRVAEPPHLLVDPQAIQFNRQSDYWLDVEAFGALVAQTERHRHRRLDACPICLSQLGEAAEYYRGEFLATLHPAGSPILDEWLLMQREKLQQQACVALQALAGSHLAHAEPERACQYARRLLRLDPWNEAAQRLMLRALLLSEGRNAALQHYQAFRRALADELRVEPEDATLELVEQIRSGALADMQPHFPFGPLPTPATPFVGRDAEQARIAGYLAGQDQRLITLYGPGGSGKSRLALEVAGAQAALWRDGLCFVPLAGVPAPQGLLDALATALDLRRSGDSLEAAHLVDFLRPKELLLILDGFEHLVDGVPLLRDIVRSAPQVKILTTSRTRLGLSTEWAVEVLGLDVPAELPATVAQAEDHAAVQLFLQSARRVAKGFGLSRDNLPHVVRICQRVSGLPLGIELAAAWVRLFPCRQIADEMEQSLDFLHTPDGRAVERHQSLRATFDYSYNLLSEAQQAHFRKLSVFRSGFTAEAARQVVGVDPAGLVCLVDRSLLQLSPARRLDMHLTLREYAAEKLAERPEEEAATRGRHGRFYLAFLREREGAIAGEDSKEALDEIQREMGNVRAAWHWAADGGQVEELGTSLQALSQFYGLRGPLQEAERVFAEAAERVAVLAAGDGVAWDAGARRVTCRLLAEQANFLRRQADYPQAIEVAQAAIALAQASREATCEARAAVVWGEALWRQGKHEEARRQLECALSLARSLPDGQKMEADCLNGLAGVSWRQGDFAAARTYLEDSLRLASDAGETRSQSIALGNLGVVAVEQADYAAARRYYRQALDIEREIGEREGEGVSLISLGNLSLYLGAYAEAERRYQQGLAIHREIGARQYEAWTLGNLGLLAYYRGDPEIARQYTREALQMAQEIGHQTMQAAMWMKVGHALAGLERLEESSEAYRKSLALRRELDQANTATEPLAGLAQVALAQEDPVQAQAHVEEILEYLDSGGTLDGTISPFQVYLTCYCVLEANQDSRAQGLMDTAHDLLQERAAKITGEEMRRSFLENVAAHREIVSAWVNKG